MLLPLSPQCRISPSLKVCGCGFTQYGVQSSKYIALSRCPSIMLEMPSACYIGHVMKHRGEWVLHPVASYLCHAGLPVTVYDWLPRSIAFTQNCASKFLASVVVVVHGNTSLNSQHSHDVRTIQIHKSTFRRPFMEDTMEIIEISETPATTQTTCC
jgi:hypothetical protein